jgi:hypothetical protein
MFLAESCCVLIQFLDQPAVHPTCSGMRSEALQGQLSCAMTFWFKSIFYLCNEIFGTLIRLSFCLLSSSDFFI